ncbi:MAG TPA: lipoprotein [Candidatus Competibacteraceae bacterium]|nr:lipoprotein [Candidatus Competibacteraceae bacterium]
MPVTLRNALMLLMLSAALAACGQKGDLYLSGTKPAAEQKARPAPSPQATQPIPSE